MYSAEFMKAEVLSLIAMINVPILFRFAKRGGNCRSWNLNLTMDLKMDMKSNIVPFS